MRPLGLGYLWLFSFLGHVYSSTYSTLELMPLIFHGVWAFLFLPCIMYINDLKDQKADMLNQIQTPFSGGSSVLQQGLLTPDQLYLGWKICIAISTIFSLLLGIIYPLMPLFQLAALLLVWGYNGKPNASYRGFGEVLQVLGLGLVLPLMGLYLQQNSLQLNGFGTFLLSLLPAHLAIAILTSLPDYDADLLVHKRTIVVKFGSKIGIGLIYAAGFSSAFLLLKSSFFVIWALIWSMLMLPCATQEGSRKQQWGIASAISWLSGLGFIVIYIG